jgi:Domain of Unknown Function with PDB structure (DUF3857)
MVTLLTLFSLLSARQARAGDEWLPVPPEDLALKDNPADPGADAMILYRESTVNASDIAARGDSDQEYYRIKIFTAEGARKYGTVEVGFLGSQGSSSLFDEPYASGIQIIGVRGRTIHPDGSIVPFDGKVLIKEAAKEGESKYLAATFTLPDVQPGSIIEYRYTKQGDARWLHNEEWTVSQDIFTREAHFTFIPPAEYTGYIPFYRVYGLPADETPKCDVGVNHSCIMLARNVSALVEEPLMPPRGALQAYVEWYYQDLGAPLQEAPAHFWNRQGKKLNDDMEHFIGKQDRLRQEVSQIVGPNDSAEVKLRKIYARVLQVRNLSMEPARTGEEKKAENLKPNSNAEDALSHGYAYGREINWLFVGLARAAGFEATEIYVTARTNNIFLPNLEYSGQLNADVVWVRADGKEYYLDPASRFFAFGLLPWYETGTAGIRISKQGGEMVSTPEPASSDAILMRHADLDISEDGTVAGTLQVDFAGQRAGLLRSEKRNEDETGRKKDLTEEIRNWLQGGSTFEITKIADWDDTTKPLHVEGTVKIPGFGSAVGRRILAPVAPFQMDEAKSFAPEKRVNPVYFPYPYEELDDVTLHAPTGYKIETLPSGPNLDKGAVSYKISTSQQKDGVETQRHLVVNGVLFPKENYAALRAFFGFVQTNDNAQIVLQGAESAKNN